MVAAQQEATRLWWRERRSEFDLFVAEPVWRESSGGDESAARRRLRLIRAIRTIPLSDAAEALAKTLAAGAKLPPKAALDALHVALATVNKTNYLLTWNCTHLASAVFRPRLESVCRAAGYELPVICTPQEFM